MNINGFKVKGKKVQKIWVAIIIAVIVAVSLIITSFYLIFNSQNKINSQDLFKFSSYYTKYNVITYSNKNQNTYTMEEYCKKENNNLKFRFNVISSNSSYSYIVTPDSFSIKSENQINEFNNYNYLQKNTNVLSLATFIEIYLSIDNKIKENKIIDNGAKLELEQRDDTISYNIIFESGKIDETNELYKYKEALVNGMKISKLELIVDNKTKIPVEYIVYLESGKAYIDIIYSEFKINPKFEEKVFSF